MISPRQNQPHTTVRRKDEAGHDHLSTLSLGAADGNNTVSPR